VNERIRTALKRASIIIGYDHKCRRCNFKVRRTSSTVTKCPECGFALWVSPVPRDIGIHKLRHTTGTFLSKAGVPIQIIQKVPGHADIKVTEGHYLHHDTRDARKALDEHLRFEGLPPPDAAAPGTIQAQSLKTGKGEGRGTRRFPVGCRGIQVVGERGFQPAPFWSRNLAGGVRYGRLRSGRDGCA
jgi:DNA-directed RNA polymerase subunit RPC12/RpoP